MTAYRHVFFDFDGVLCDSLDDAMAVFNDVRRRLYPQVPAVADRSDMVHVYGGRLSTCLRRWLDPDDHKRFFDAHSRAMMERAGSLRLFAGAARLLDRLPCGSASIVTSAYSDAVRGILTEGGRRSCPRAIREIMGRERRMSKAVKIETLLKRYSLNAADCVYVGDLESDIIYCREVPIDVVAVSYGYHPAWHLRRCGPDHLVGSVGELEELLVASVASTGRVERTGGPAVASHVGSD